MEDEKLTFGVILSLVGGLVILAYGVYELYLGMSSSSLSSIGGFPVTDLGGVVTGGTVGIAMGVMIIILSGLISGLPEHHTELGTLVILAALLSLMSVGGGNGVGFLLSVVGGACAIAFGPEEVYLPPRRSPTPPSLAPAGSEPGSVSATTPGNSPAATAPAPSSASSYRGCGNCGKFSPAQFTVCPSCGQKF